MRGLVALIWLASAVCAPLHAAEAPPAQPAEPATTDKPAVDKPDEKPAEKAEEASAETKAGNEKSAADQKPSPQRFIPSEQVRADFDVSFPIDI